MKHALIFCLMLCCLSIAKGQRQEGKHFVLAFMEHVDYNENRKKLYLTTRKKSLVKVRIPALSWEKELTINTDDAVQLELPKEVETLDSEKKGNLSVWITATEPISVFAHQFSNARSDAALIFPIASLGREYVAVTYNGHFEDDHGHPAEFLVLATKNNTEVYIHPTARTYRNRGPGRPITITLDAGETYQVQAGHYSSDLTGSQISANKPVAVFSGNMWTQVPTSCRAPDNLFTQLCPIESAGKEFVVVPSSQGAFDIVRIISAGKGTEVFLDGRYTTTLYEGEFWELSLRDNPMHIRTSRPAQVARYLTGYGCAADGGESLQSDPSLFMVNHIRQSVQEAVFWAPSQARIGVQELDLVVRAADANSVKLDGNTVYDFKPVPGASEFFWARKRVSLGKHKLEAGGCGVAAYLSGYGRLESYAFPIGTGFSLLDMQAKGLIPEGGCLTDTFTFISQIDSSLAETIWNMGDGKEYFQPVARHAYDEPGVYRVSLELHNRCLGISDTLWGTVVVTPPLKVNTMSDTMICAGDTLRLRASLTPGAEYAWTGPG
ncbi:MAG: PKD domain-containing protein, partial [Bacteroidia bacterium]